MLARILSLIWKEFISVLRDPKIRISIFLPPIIQLLIFTPAATLDVKNVPIGILNRDAGEQAFELVQRFHGSPFFSRIVYLKSIEEIKPFIDRQNGIMVISIDEQFSRRLDHHLTAEIQLILDGRKTNTSQILVGYVSTIINEFNQTFTAKANIQQQNIKLFPRFWYNPNINYTWYNIPCLFVTLSMLTCLVVVTQSVARERELGTFDQLLVSPLSPFEILIGKIVPGIVIGMIEGVFLMAVGVLLYRVPFTGSFPLFLLSQLIFVSAISGIGLFISSVSYTQQQAMLGTFTFMTPSVLLSGFATPVENMPGWLQPISYLIPMKYMLIISKGIFLKAMPASLVFNNIWPMILIAICSLLGAGIFFKKKLQ